MIKKKIKLTIRLLKSPQPFQTQHFKDLILAKKVQIGGMMGGSITFLSDHGSVWTWFSVDMV